MKNIKEKKIGKLNPLQIAICIILANEKEVWSSFVTIAAAARERGL